MFYFVSELQFYYNGSRKAYRVGKNNKIFIMSKLKKFEVKKINNYDSVVGGTCICKTKNIETGVVEDVIVDGHYIEL